jgi:alanyl-tRNA synthetase
MTERLYYADSYQKSFQARVVEYRDGAARLNRSAFYPTSGGQPFDTGMLGGHSVTDVWVDETGEVWHRVDGTLEPGTDVTGEVDWARRFDHMQQHAGEHMLAGKIHKRLGGHTIGLHLGADVSTIDVELPGSEMRVPENVLDEIEDAVNADIQRDLPIRCWFPTEEEMTRLPLRKAPTVKEHIRIVLVGGEADGECVACGGTHPSSTGQIGIVRILDARPSRGKMRVTFVCGMRAVMDARLRGRMADRAAATLSVPVEKLPEAVEGALERERAVKALFARERLGQAVRRADALWEVAADKNGWRVIADAPEGMDINALREMAARLTAHTNTIALLESAQPEGNYLIVFARTEGDGPNMGKLLSDAAKKLGGKGGGRPEFAQGGAPVPGTASAGAAALENAL